MPGPGPTEFFFEQTGSNYYLTGFHGGFDFAGHWIDTEKLTYLTFNIWWGAATSTAGTLSIQGTNDVYKGLDPNSDITGNVPDGETITVLTPHVIHGNSGSLTVSDTASKVIVTVNYLPKLVRVAYTMSAGGGGNQFFCRAFGRVL